jgi:uncharacterized iron-regulated protein
MGMFKQTKEAFQVLRSDELKDLKRKADAQPKTSMMDGVRMANEAMDQMPAWQQQGADMQQMAANAGAYVNGVVGNATVNAISETGTMINNAPVMDLDLTVSVPGREPYQVTHRQLVALSAIPNFQPGKMFPVHVDHLDPSKIVIG